MGIEQTIDRIDLQILPSHQALKERAESMELGNREFAELLKAKEAQMEKQRVQIQKMEAEQQALQIRLEAERPDTMREQELERLRTELVSATESARRLFGAAIEAETEQGETVDTRGMGTKLLLLDNKSLICQLLTLIIGYFPKTKLFE